MDELSASTGSNGLGVDRVIGGAISSFIKRIVLPSGVVLRSHIDRGRVANKRGGAGERESGKDRREMTSGGKRRGGPADARGKR